MANQKSAELSQPRVGPFHDPEALVAAQFSSILVAPLFVVAPVGRDQFNAALVQPFPQRVRVLGPIRDHSLRLLLRPAFDSGDADFGKRGFRKCSFSQRGTFKPNSQRKSLTVDQYHPLRALAALVLPTADPPFWRVRNCRPENSLPTAISLRRPVLPTMRARRRAKRPALPSAAIVASKWPEKDTAQVETAIPRPS